MWLFRSKVGTFKIALHNNGRFGLWIGDELLGSYHSPHAAADDVYMYATGHWPWDQQMMVLEPCDLGEWQQVR